MSASAELLPPGSGAAMQAIAETVVEVLDVPLVQLLNPATTTETWLPYLAYQESVDLWFSDWSTERKRQMIASAAQLAAMKGLRIGVSAFLAFVDGAVLDVIAYPRRFVMGRSAIGRIPVGLPPHVARYLVRIEIVKPARAFTVGRSALGRDRIKTMSSERLRRGLQAMRAAKAPETEYRADFAHKRKLRISDAPLLRTARLDQFIHRIKL